MKGTGILINDSYELKIHVTHDSNGLISGGLVVGNVLYQNQALIMQFYPGVLKTAPVVGVGMSDALLSYDYLEWRRKIRSQLELDGQKVKQVQFSPSKEIIIDAEYSNS